MADVLDRQLLDLSREVGKRLCALGDHVMVNRGGSSYSDGGVKRYFRWDWCDRKCGYEARTEVGSIREVFGG